MTYIYFFPAYYLFIDQNKSERPSVMSVRPEKYNTPGSGNRYLQMIVQSSTVNYSCEKYLVYSLCSMCKYTHRLSRVDHTKCNLVMASDSNPGLCGFSCSETLPKTKQNKNNRNNKTKQNKNHQHKSHANYLLPLLLIYYGRRREKKRDKNNKDKYK